ncbi:glycosyltransferase [Chlamydiota bacterium]
MKKPKILMLITELDIGGAETIVYNQVRELRRRGFDVAVACLYGKGVMAKKIVDAGIRVYFLQACCKYDFRVLFRLRKILKEQHFDVLHCHLFHANIIGRFAAIRIKSIRIISTIHVMEIDKLYRIWFDGITSFLVDRYICVSKSVKQFIMQKANVSAKKITVVYNGIDLDQMIPTRSSDQIKQEWGLTNEVVIGSVGRLHEQKGHSYLLEAFQLILKKGINIRLVIVGEGPLRQFLEAKTVSLDIAQCVAFIGFKEDIINYMQVLDIFVLPSLWEGFGLVVTEAMALAKPVIATDVDGVPEIVCNSKTGYIVEPASVEMLAEKITALVIDRQKSSEMGLLGRERVRNYFSHKQMVSTLILVYNSL